MTRGDGKRKWTFPCAWDNQTCSGSVDKGMEKPRAEEWRQLVVICLGAFLFFNSFGSINVALPTIQIHFGASLAAVQWISIMGTVAISSLSLCFGRAGDLLGRQRLYRTGVSLYALGAGLTAFSESFPQLLLFRGVMAIGLALAVPMSAAILASTYPAQHRGQALGLLASALAVGRTTGPTLGGLILYLWGWRAVFLANCLIGIVISVAVFSIFKGSDERRKETFDFWGALALMIGYPALLIGLSVGTNSGWSSSWFGVALVGLASFVWIEMRTKNPLVDISLFSRRPLSAALVSLVLGSAVYSPITLCAPLYMQNVLASSPLTVGIIMAALPLCTALSSPLSGRLADRLDARLVASLGLFSIFIGIAFYARLDSGSIYLLVILALALIGLGIGFFMPANQKIAFSSVAGEHYGILSAMLSSLGSAAGTLGTTIAVALIEATLSGRETQDPASFAPAQQFAFSALLPLAALALLVSLGERSGRKNEG